MTGASLPMDLSTGKPASLNLPSLMPYGSHLKLMLNGQAAHFYADLEELSLSSIQQKVKEAFRVSVCRLTYLDEQGVDSMLWSDLLHFKLIAWSRDDAMVVKVHPSVCDDTPAAAAMSDVQTAADAPVAAAAAADSVAAVDPIARTASPLSSAAVPNAFPAAAATHAASLGAPAASINPAAFAATAAPTAATAVATNPVFPTFPPAQVASQSAAAPATLAAPAAAAIPAAAGDPVARPAVPLYSAAVIPDAFAAAAATPAVNLAGPAASINPAAFAAFAAPAAATLVTPNPVFPTAPSAQAASQSAFAAPKSAPSAAPVITAAPTALSAPPLATPPASPHPATSASECSGGQSDCEIADAPLSSGEACFREEARLAGFSVGTYWADWELVSGDLGRTREPSRDKCVGMQARQQADEEAEEDEEADEEAEEDEEEHSAGDDEGMSQTDVGSDPSGSDWSEHERHTDTALAPRKKSMLWSKAEEKTLIAWRMKKPWVGWACVRAQLGNGRSANACRKKWKRLRAQAVRQADEQSETDEEDRSMESSEEVAQRNSDGGSSVCESSDIESDRETVDAPLKAQRRWSRDDERRLVAVCRAETCFSWEHVGRKLGRPEWACQSKCLELRTKLATKEADGNWRQMARSKAWGVARSFRTGASTGVPGMKIRTLSFASPKRAEWNGPTLLIIWGARLGRASSSMSACAQRVALTGWGGFWAARRPERLRRPRTQLN
jgi:hypothetical protein